MAADLHIHAIPEEEGTELTEEHVKAFKSNELGSKYFGYPRLGKEWTWYYQVVSDSPNVHVGEVSWLKAALFDDEGRYVPTPVKVVHGIIGEDFPIIDDDLIKKITEALSQENMTGYSMTPKDEIISWLEKHKGLKCFTVSW